MNPDRKAIRAIIKFIEREFGVSYIESSGEFLKRRCDNCSLEEGCEAKGHLPCILHKYKEE